MKKRKKDGAIAASLILVLLISLIVLLFIYYDAAQVISDSIGAWNQFCEEQGLPPIPLVQEKTHQVQPIEPLPEDETFRYYGSLLDEEEFQTYEMIRRAVATRTPSLSLEVKDLDRLLTLVGYVRNDNPEYFWFTDSTRAEGYEKEGTYYITLFLDYNCTEAEQNKFQSEIDSVTAEVISRLAPLTEYEKVKGVYEFIINRTSYDKNYTDQSCYTALVHRRGVCAGYTNAANYLLHKLGISTIYVSGTAKEEEHCWSLVKVNGSWYQMDVTWGDPVLEDHTEMITYTYFLTTDKDIYLDHTLAPDNPPLPECRSTGCNYYVWQGRYLDTMDFEYISRMLTDAASRREVLEFKCSNQPVYEGILRYLVEEEGLWAAMNFAHYYYPVFDQYQAAYSSDDVHHIIRITPAYDPVEG